MHSNTVRWIIGVSCLAGLVSMYLFFQHADVASLAGATNKELKFIINKTLRFLMNDFLMIGIIYALFLERKYVVFALWVQLTGFVLFLLPYFFLKLVVETGNGPLVSFLHRLVLNPTLLLLLIPVLYFQRSKAH